MPPEARPAAEVDIDETMIRRLLTEQHPDLADLPLHPLAEGWDNVLYRLGADLTVRLPRRSEAAALVEHEQRWLGELASTLPIPIGAPTRIGTPTPDYPFPWSICPWFDGTSAVGVDAAADAPERLGAFLRALHRPAPPDAPHNPYRGIPLRHRDTITRERIEAIGPSIDSAGVLTAWTECLLAPAFSGEPRWIHGDLHPGNLVVDADGHLVAAIDFGDLTSGDPACDLAVGWMWFDGDARMKFFGASGAQDAPTVERSRGWAITLAVAYLAHSADAPDMADIGRATLARAAPG